MTTRTAQGLTIGETAERTGLSADTLRYYERIGLISPVGRSASGHRVYAEEDLGRLEVVLKLRNTGMPMRDMLAFVRLADEGPHTAAERRDLLGEHRTRMLAQAERLRDTIAFVDGKIAVYSGLAAECPQGPGGGPGGQTAGSSSPSTAASMSSSTRTAP